MFLKFTAHPRITWGAGGRRRRAGLGGLVPRPVGAPWGSVGFQLPEVRGCGVPSVAALRQRRRKRQVPQGQPSPHRATSSALGCQGLSDTAAGPGTWGPASPRGPSHAHTAARCLHFWTQPGCPGNVSEVPGHPGWVLGQRRDDAPPVAVRSLRGDPGGRMGAPHPAVPRSHVTCH